MRLTRNHGVVGSAVGAVALVALTTALLSGCVSTPHHVAAPSSTQATTSAEPVNLTCASSWAMGTSDYAHTRWFSEGIPEIKQANTPEEARNAAHVWLDGVRKDPNLLSGAALYFFKNSVPPSDLVENGCATETAVQLAIQLEFLFTQSDITPSQAPTSGYNSSVHNATVIGAASSGVTGNATSRKAILITLPDGSKIWIMARCGNVVTPGPPPHRCEAPTPHGTWPICKDGPTADPAQQGHVPSWGTGVAPAQTDTVGPPAGGIPPTTYTAPPSPTATATPVPTVTPTTGPQPTVAPSTQPPANGNVPPTSTGPACNPEFQSCP